MPQRYCAGAMVLDVEDPRRILYRAPDPTQVPLLPEERRGVVNNDVAIWECFWERCCEFWVVIRPGVAQTMGQNKRGHGE